MRPRNLIDGLVASPAGVGGMVVMLVGVFYVVGVAVGAAMATTITLGLSAAAIAVPLALVIYGCIRGSGFISQTLLVSCVVLALLPMVVHVSGWDAAIGKLGWFAANRGNVLVPLISGWWAAVWIHSLVAAPQVALMLLVCDGGERRVYEEQAMLDAGYWATFSQVTVWRLAPVLVGGVLWTVICCAREIAVVDLYQVETFAEQIYLGYSLGEAGSTEVNLSRWAWTAYMAAMGLAGVTVVFLLGNRFQPAQDEVVRRRSSGSKATAVVGMLLLGLLVLVPIGNVLARASFYVDASGKGLQQRYALWAAWRAIEKSWWDYQYEVFWSLAISGVAATAVVAGSVIVAGRALRSRVWLVGLALWIAIGLALPGPAIGVWLNRAFAGVQFGAFRYLVDYTIFAPVAANIIYTGPIIGMIVWFVLRQTPKNMLGASELDGATAAIRFWRFELAVNRWAVVGCWILGGVLCFGELAASQMVRPAGMDTVPRKMLGDLHAGVNELTAGATIWMATAAIMIALVGWSVVKLGLRRV